MSDLLATLNLPIHKPVLKVIGMGGGSAMDVAKAIAVVAAHNAEAKDFLGLNKVPGPGLPTIMIPTTAGTGSEVTFTAVFVRHDLRKKEGMNSIFMYPDLALLDPELTLSLPPQPTAASGMDALCHAIESYTSVIASPASEMFSLEAIQLISENLRTCVHNGSDLEAREAQMLGSLYAGIGLANAGVGAAHSLSYPLGGKYGISHGVANTLMLPRIMEFNLPGALEKFAVVAELMGENTEGLSVRDAAMLAVEAVDLLIEDCDIATSLEELGIPIDLSLAFHTDAGITRNDTVVGTLSIFSTEDGNSARVFPDSMSRLANRDFADILQTIVQPRIGIFIRRPDHADHLARTERHRDDVAGFQFHAAGHAVGIGLVQRDRHQHIDNARRCD